MEILNFKLFEGTMMVESVELMFFAKVQSLSRMRPNAPKKILLIVCGENILKVSKLIGVRLSCTVLRINSIAKQEYLASAPVKVHDSRT